MTHRYLVITSFSLFLTACGGNNDSENTPPVVVQPPPPTINEGGTLSSPSSLSSELPNIISANQEQNYFVFDSNENDLLIMHATLQTPLDMADYELCASANGFSDAYVGMTIQDVIQSCSMDLLQRFDGSDTQLLQVAYKYDVEGEFEAALFDPTNIMNGDISAQGTGRPDDPKLITVDADNVLQANNFYNYFAIYLNAGDEIMIDVYPNNLPSDAERIRCGFSQPTNSYLGFGISADYGEHECYESTYLTADTSKNYVFHFKGTQDDASGYFRAAVFRL